MTDDGIPDLADALEGAVSDLDRARILLAFAAYPGGDDGLPANERTGSRNGPAARFCEALLDWRMNKAPLASIRRQLGRKVKRRKYESWIGIYEQGCTSLKAAEAAYWARMNAGFYGVPLSRVMDRLPRTLTRNLAIYTARDSEELKRDSEAPNYDLEYVAKRIRAYDPAMHLIHALRGVASKHVRVPNLGTIAAAVPSLITHFHDWPAEAIADAETFRLLQADHMGYAMERMIPLTKRAAQIT